ncbi:MAG TPA: alpha-L-fucosidase, partial [Beutenbergiaceae bacterium]|nr:alpha-L-fucosidase [Beutenbergiaceae bacterium]
QASMPLGLYLSPWDRNAPCYDDPPAYDEFYLRQLTELCTWYGPLVELWFDGAGSQGRQYDWPAINAVIAEHQPQAMVFNMGEATIRWVGNEDGLAHDPVHYVVEETDFSNYTEQTTSLDRARYLPPECDVSLRRGWFWSAADEPKSLQHLLAIYYSSVGMGANLLLNVPPDNRGLIGADDQARLQQWRAELDRRFATPSAAELTSDGATWVADFGRDVTLDHLELAEDYSRGQWIGAHQVHSADQLLASGQTVGHRRIHTFAPVSTDRLHITLDDEDAVLAAVRGYATGGAAPGTVGYLASTEQPQ